MLEQFQSTGTELAERAVIGAALADKAAIRWASEHVTADDFSSPWLGAAWETPPGRAKGGEPGDGVTQDGAFGAAGQSRSQKEPSAAEPSRPGIDSSRTHPAPTLPMHSQPRSATWTTLARRPLPA